ncbi:class I SAM-dependent methyltransferase [Actinoplanes sp. N902-109]|uniref:class I SAM-dependent methyltransferase n=1 Tax=Actinoplanes sp. (strain N902-109) TaxID=649831 RepID=UPI00032955FB|nr:class I SAM-dependent methyltransferase [Actinoplanes sp. N902-109]AGL21324.1 methyltransferase [Actinoplanes sp. N902-109]
MARIAYDETDAAAFAATRHLPADALTEWRAAAARHLPRTGTLVDLGAGTGMWSRAFTGWFPALRVVAVEPSAAMRNRAAFRPLVAGDAGHLPLAAGSADAVWLSTVIHHVPDLRAAGRELRRVLRPGGKVLIRSVFAGRPDGVSLFRWWPSAVRVLDTYPSIEEIVTAFDGFTAHRVESVPQVTAPSARVAAERLRRAAHTPLQLITDAEFAEGLARLRAETSAEPVVDSLDLLVLE